MININHFVYRVDIRYAPGQEISFLSAPIEGKGSCGAVRSFPISMIKGNDREAMKKAIGPVSNYAMEQYLKIIYG